MPLDDREPWYLAEPISGVAVGSQPEPAHANIRIEGSVALIRLGRNWARAERKPCDLAAEWARGRVKFLLGALFLHTETRKQMLGCRAISWESLRYKSTLPGNQMSLTMSLVVL